MHQENIEKLLKKVSFITEPILGKTEARGFPERKWEIALKIVICYYIISEL